ncbi:hypothetical protein GLOTRDRAFT_141347 [Gloeophyllum trabeum ATCC 11539]|uniref:DUF6699 domain-containing protein n=1 Tax=Gloeophyllum trabeum (strain ATCC 11539 / FP-39264 / Madison 617) TaxID=670483 RepID=S7PU66_GLOTA|nr:uncharacterized protein GLOTRDRAFT_141347 [Gloeophyllum trabeum ATCC 11539]EPQ50872.1 hypothetical protein GLOTRDRAFT_141347 [Gloeophyllum trabeum ATCC 11539]
MPTLLAARRVHFDSTQNLIHPLSPTSSLSSLDTDGPETPPSPQPAFLPPVSPHYLSHLRPKTFRKPPPSPLYTFSPGSNSSNSSYGDPVPVPVQPPMAVHPLLAAPDAHRPFLEILDYDLSFPFDPTSLSVLTRSGRLPLPHDVLIKPATSPSVTHLTISLRNFRCPSTWTVHVTPSTATAAPGGGEYGRAPELVPFVTVADVLAHLYTHLRTPVSKLEYDMLEDGMKRRVGESFHRRYTRYAPQPERARRGSVSGRAPSRTTRDGARQRSASLSAVDPRYEEERRKGVKRVDWLQGRTMFGGLKWERGDTWILCPR